MVEPSLYGEETGQSSAKDAEFPDAPHGWSKAEAKKTAEAEGLEANESLWEVVRTIQDYFAEHERYNAREIHDALEEKFHHRGGMKFLYTLLPGGPVSQGCKLAGIPVPAGATDLSFGSVS